MKNALTAAVAVIGLLGSLGAEIGVQTKTEVTGGVTIVSNGKKPSPPPGAPSTLVLEEMFSIGQEGPADAAFAELSTFAVDDEGFIFILDRKDNRIKIFNPEAKFVRAFGKQGQGPGEMNGPVGISITPAGEILVEDALNQRLTFFRKDGMFLRNLSTAKALGLTGIKLLANGTMIGRSMAFGEKNSLLWTVKIFGPDLATKTTLYSVDFPNPLESRFNPFSLAFMYDLDARGNIFIGLNKDFEISVFTPEGKLVRKVRRDYDPVPITDEDKKKILSLIPETPGFNIKEKMEFPKVFPATSTFLLADDGKLIVRTYEKGPAKDEFWNDVFDPEGRYLARFSHPCTFSVLRAGLLYGTDENEDGYRTLRCFRVRWKN
jgi:hypothetical protein